MKKVCRRAELDLRMHYMYTALASVGVVVGSLKRS
jgi:hypothetical protein